MQDRLEQLGHEITMSGGRAIVVEADMTDKSQAQAAVEQTVATLGWLDILVNKVGRQLEALSLTSQFD